MAKNAVKITISLLWYCGEVVRSTATRLLGRRGDPRFIVLYYHGVGGDATAGFARQMDLLERIATVVRADHTGPLPGSRRCVAITFDDAFRSVREHALPELVRRSLPLTIFVPVEYVGSPPGWAMESPVDHEEVMTGEELRALPDNVDLGSHTLSHPHLSQLSDERLQEEVEQSRLKLVELVGKPVTTLAFPYGDYDQRTLAACRTAGYERLFAIEPRLADPRGADFVRGRIAVEPTDSALVFRLKASGAFAWMTYASALKSRLLARRSRP
ncbi:MAG: polysaccharide deacetylase family protein [Solirubrobacterales bacterium]|nr:polysaccharide deacetylase family protein [Solirubrobacterales bacterium]